MPMTKRATREMVWFGRAHGSAVERECRRIDAPEGEPCIRCDEAIGSTDDGFITANGCPFHRACFLRMTVGSLAHQLHLCSCFVGQSAVSHEPGWMTRRQAAEEAVRFYEGRHELSEQELRIHLLSNSST